MENIIGTIVGLLAITAMISCAITVYCFCVGAEAVASLFLLVCVVAIIVEALTVIIPPTAEWCWDVIEELRWWIS